MPKPRTAAPPPPAPPAAKHWLGRLSPHFWTLGSWLTPVLLPLLLTGLVLLGVVRLGQAARGDLSTRDRATIAFAHVECASPPGLDREEFLSEVQYLAGWPDRLNLLDDDVAIRLATAFAQHPWVEQVESVTLRPQSVRVRLRFRTPVLAVRTGGRLRAVDGQGILLPATAPIGGLPVFEGIALTPQGPAGTPWGDPSVLLAASHGTNQ